MIFLLLAACSPLPETVTMSASVWNAPYGEGTVVPGATVAVMDEAAAVVDEVTAAEDGSFVAEVPAGVPFFVTVSADGHVPTVFSGTAGISDFAAPEGYPWVAPDAYVDALRTEFANCPTVGEPGGVVAGEIVGDALEYPVIETGSARLYGPDDAELPACYLDEEGVSSPDATQVGSSGRFAIFGVPAGEVVVDVRYATGTGEDPVELYRFFASEGGLVPLFPAILPLI